MDAKKKYCRHCGGDLSIRNPTGKCDHLYYPDYCEACKNIYSKLKKKDNKDG
jgi:hypothetical protein